MAKRSSRGFVSALSLVAVGLAIAALAGTQWFQTSDQIASKGYQRSLAGNTVEAVTLFETAVHQDPASPYRWCDLGETLLLAGDSKRARQAMARAVEFGPRIVPVLIRAANFSYRVGEERQALPYGARILSLVEQYDEAVFGLYDSLDLGVDSVLREGLGREPRAARAYLRHLMERADREGARAAWEWAQARRAADDGTAEGYVRWLVKDGRRQQAAQAWAQHTGGREPGYPGENAIYNGSFEKEPIGTVFDWKIVPVRGAQATRDADAAKLGGWCLRVRFDGTENVAFGHVSQSTVVRPGEYRFEAWMRSEDVSTDRGVALEIADVDSNARLRVKTEEIRGTAGWMRVERSFRVGEGTELVEVRFIREPSWKFDNKISGTVWIDGVSLRRAPGPVHSE